MDRQKYRVFVIIGFLAGAYLGLTAFSFFRNETGISIGKTEFGSIMIGGMAFLGALVGYALAARQLLDQKAVKLKAAHEVNKTKDEFISMVLHHLRTPLSGMRWVLKEILKESAGSRAKVDRKKLEILDDENDRVLEAVNHLIEASRAATGRIVYNFELISLNELQELIRESIRKMAPAIRAKGLELIEALPQFSENAVKVDKEKIIIAVETILENAVKYTDKGEIKVSSEKDYENFYFSVSDTGIGVPVKNQKEMFLQFFRSEAARRLDPNGFGIGLFIVKIFIDNHKGAIWFASIEGKGTTFTFRLPIIKASGEKFLEKIS